MSRLNSGQGDKSPAADADSLSYRLSAADQAPDTFLVAIKHLPCYSHRLLVTFAGKISLAITISTVDSRPEPDDSNAALGEFFYRPETRLCRLFPDGRDLGTHGDRQPLLHLFQQPSCGR